jgi:hypothetical protein
MLSMVAICFFNFENSVELNTRVKCRTRLVNWNEMKLKNCSWVERCNKSEVQNVSIHHAVTLVQECATKKSDYV